MLIKPKQTAHFVTFTGHFCTFRLWYGGRAALSVKGAQQFLDNKKQTYPHKIPARPCAGRPLTDCALLSLFWGAPKGTEAPKLSRFRWGFVSIRFGYCRKTVRQPCLLFPAVKVYAISKKFWRCPF